LNKAKGGDADEADEADEVEAAATEEVAEKPKPKRKTKAKAKPAEDEAAETGASSEE